MKIIKTPGMLVLAIYLILIGLTSFVHLNLGILLPILALVAGVLILIGK